MSQFLDANPPGLWLRMQREAAGLTQEELAHDAGLSVRAISNLERDRTRRPHADSLRRIARSLGLPEAAVARLIARSRAARLIAADPPPVAGTTEDLNTARRDYPGRNPVVVPRQLPAAVAPFAGRDTELGILDKWLTGTMQGCRKAVGVAVIAGMAGIGKTALAVHWAHRVANDFPDGQLYVDLLGCHPGGQAADASQVMRGFLHALGVAPEQIPAAADEMTALYRSVLAGKRVLVVADNARNSAQVRPLLPSGPGSMIVVTSRSQLTGLVAADGARIWNLDVLSSADATAFMAARLGPDRVEAEACAVEDLARLCGGLPLALAIVAARADLSGWPLAVFAKQLLTAEDRLEALGLDDPAADLRAVFSWSCQQLSSDTRRLFWLLAVHPGPDISVPAAASLAGVSAARAATMLRELASACLAAERLPGRYSLHDLLRAYAAEQAAALPEMDADHGAAEHAMFQYYLHMALDAARLLEPAQPASPEPPATGVILEQAATGDEALAWFDTEREVLLAVLARAAQIGSHVLAQQLAGALEVFFRRRSNWHDLSATQEIALRSAEKLGDIKGQAHAHLHLGHALGRLGDADATRAHLATAVTLSRELHDLSLEAWAHLGVCLLHPDNCDTTELIESSLRALPLAEAAGDTSLVAHACNNLGYGYALAGRY